MSTVQILSPVPACLALCMVGGLFFSQQRKLGYDDTPRLPDSPWRVHDGSRPQPPSVSPGPAGGAPADALVLFDGSNLGEWNGAWKTDGEQMTLNGSGSMTTRRSFGDCQLHLEFATPAVTDVTDAIDATDATATDVRRRHPLPPPSGLLAVGGPPL